MGRVEGKVALITGAARGMGRAHCLRLAEEGADIVAVDLAAPVPSVPYDMATPEDLDETARLVEALGRNVLARRADVRDQAALDDVVAEATTTLGGIDIAVANAGVSAVGRAWEFSEEQWRDVIDINLTGVWHTAKAVIPSMIEARRGGAIVLVSSTGGLKGLPHTGPYTAAKHAVVGLMRTLANELGSYRIRVNTVNPTTVDTPMVMNDTMYRIFRPDLEAPGRSDMEVVAPVLNVLPVAWIDPVDVANAVLWLCSDEARYVTGVALPVDAGATIK